MIQKQKKVSKLSEYLNVTAFKVYCVYDPSDSILNFNGNQTNPNIFPADILMILNSKICKSTGAHIICLVTIAPLNNVFTLHFKYFQWVTKWQDYILK